MNSTPNSNATETDDVLVARADQRLAHVYEQIARADEQIARVNDQLSKLEHDGARHPSVLSRRPPHGRSRQRGLIGLLLAACIFAAAFVSQSSYGDAVKLIVAGWAPQRILASSEPLEKSGQPRPSTVQVAAAEPVASQAAPSADTAPQDVAPPAAPIPAELTQLLQTMARDVGNLQQGIEQLKASQEEMARENARTAEQFKASQDQMTRLIAKVSETKVSDTKATDQKVSEQNLRPRPSAPPRPRPVATPPRKPVPPSPSQQARAQPRAPVQLQPEQ
jgi:hypothetical protein